MTRKTKGSIVIPTGLNVWNHELKTAQVHAKKGYVVDFVAVSINH